MAISGCAKNSGFNLNSEKNTKFLRVWGYAEGLIDFFKKFFQSSKKLSTLTVMIGANWYDKIRRRTKSKNVLFYLRKGGYPQ